MTIERMKDEDFSSLRRRWDTAGFIGSKVSAVFAEADRARHEESRRTRQASAALAALREAEHPPMCNVTDNGPCSCSIGEAIEHLEGRRHE